MMYGLKAIFKIIMGPAVHVPVLLISNFLNQSILLKFAHFTVLINQSAHLVVQRCAVTMNQVASRSRSCQGQLNYCLEHTSPSLKAFFWHKLFIILFLDKCVVKKFLEFETFL